MSMQTIPVTGFGAGQRASGPNGMPIMHSHGAVALASPSARFTWQNVSLRKTLERIAAIHATMGESSGARTEELIREARAGGMYGTAPGE